MRLNKTDLANIDALLGFARRNAAKAEAELDRGVVNFVPLLDASEFIGGAAELAGDRNRADICQVRAEVARLATRMGKVARQTIPN